MNYQEQFNGFSDREDMANQFQIDVSELNNIFVIYAEYDIGDYCGDAHVLFVRDGKLREVHGSHCSCYGLEGQWSEEETFPEAALKNSRFEHLDILKDMMRDPSILKRMNMNKMWTSEDDLKLQELLARKEAAAAHQTKVRENARNYLSTYIDANNGAGKAAQSAMVDALVENLDEVISELNKLND